MQSVFEGKEGGIGGWGGEMRGVTRRETGTPHSFPALSFSASARVTLALLAIHDDHALVHFGQAFELSVLLVVHSAARPVLGAHPAEFVFELHHASLGATQDRICPGCLVVHRAQLEVLLVEFLQVTRDLRRTALQRLLERRDLGVPRRKRSALCGQFGLCGSELGQGRLGLPRLVGQLSGEGRHLRLVLLVRGRVAGAEGVELGAEHRERLRPTLSHVCELCEPLCHFGLVGGADLSHLGRVRGGGLGGRGCVRRAQRGQSRVVGGGQGCFTLGGGRGRRLSLSRETLNVSFVGRLQVREGACVACLCGGDRCGVQRPRVRELGGGLRASGRKHLGGGLERRLQGCALFRRAGDRCRVGGEEFVTLLGSDLLSLLHFVTEVSQGRLVGCVQGGHGTRVLGDESLPLG